MIYQILQAIFIFITITSVQTVDDDSNYLCAYECNDEHYPNFCNPDNLICPDYSSNPDNTTQQCPLFGSQIFSSESTCSKFQAAESNSLYCLYKCSDTDFPNECLPKGQVCPLIHQETDCPLYHDPVIFNGVSECEEFRENGWAIEDCISCCNLADRVAERWSEIVDDGCGVVYDTFLFGATLAIGAVATPGAAVAFDLFMIGVDGITAVFSKKHDGLGDTICDAVSDASSEAIARDKAEEVCGNVLDGCSGCDFQTSIATDASDITCEDAKEKANSAECQCFSRDSFVMMYPGFEAKAIYELEIGDKVLTYDEVYDEFVFEEVMIITHEEDEYNTDMLSLIFNNGANNITLTPNHLLYINGNIAPASSGKIGDYLSFYNNERVYIEDIVPTKQYPMNVWTHNGNMVINGVSATSFDSTAGMHARKIMQYGYRYPSLRTVIAFVARFWNNVNKNQLIGSFVSKC